MHQCIDAREPGHEGSRGALVVLGMDEMLPHETKARTSKGSVILIATRAVAGQIARAADRTNQVRQSLGARGNDRERRRADPVFDIAAKTTGNSARGVEVVLDERSRVVSEKRRDQRKHFVEMRGTP